MIFECVIEEITDIYITCYVVNIENEQETYIFEIPKDKFPTTIILEIGILFYLQVNEDGVEFFEFKRSFSFENALKQAEELCDYFKGDKK